MVGWLVRRQRLSRLSGQPGMAAALLAHPGGSTRRSQDRRCFCHKRDSILAIERKFCQLLKIPGLGRNRLAKLALESGATAKRAGERSRNFSRENAHKFTKGDQGWDFSTRSRQGHHLRPAPRGRTNSAQGIALGNCPVLRQALNGRTNAPFPTLPPADTRAEHSLATKVHIAHKMEQGK